jgi:hypothetical protein
MLELGAAVEPAAGVASAAGAMADGAVAAGAGAAAGAVAAAAGADVEASSWWLQAVADRAMIEAIASMRMEFTFMATSRSGIKSRRSGQWLKTTCAHGYWHDTPRCR